MKGKYKDKIGVSKTALQPLQLPLSLADRVRLLQGSVHEFTNQVVNKLVIEILSEEIQQLCGKQYKHNSKRRYTRYGYQEGVVTVLGRKTRVVRPRARSIDGKEAQLESYGLLTSPDAFSQPVVAAMLRGVSARDYKGVAAALGNSCGVERSAVSRAFVRGTAKAVREFTERRFDESRFIAMVIDGIEFGDTTFVVALGIDSKGNKVVCGAKEGATENSTVVKSLLSDLIERGVSTTKTMLFVIDGSKALAKGIRDVFGEYGLIQRCRIHKKRNIKAHLQEKYWSELEKRLNCAWGEDHSHSEALKRLKTTVKWLERINPDAAASLEEGMEETITVNLLNIKGTLKKSLSSTNVIESAFSIVRRRCRRVTRWREGDMRRRWCIAGLLSAENSFQRIRGFSELPELVAKLDLLTNQKSVDLKKEAA